MARGRRDHVGFAAQNISLARPVPRHHLQRVLKESEGVFPVSGSIGLEPGLKQAYQSRPVRRQGMPPEHFEDARPLRFAFHTDEIESRVARRSLT